jgi:two-component system KDP operon response regulator KdpE
MAEGSRTVLIVEDDPALRLLCRVNLELEGWRVVEAATLADARDGLAVADVVLLDLHVAGEDGRALLHESKEERGDRPVVILTGSAEVDEETRAVADDVVAKPFAPDELIEAVAAAARRESLREK